MSTEKWKVISLDMKRIVGFALLVGLLTGIVGGVSTNLLLMKTGPQGPQGSQGNQGAPGANGTNTIMQIIQNRNQTVKDVSGYTTMQWHNISVFDSSMAMTINIQQNSKLFAEFSAVQSFNSPASMWIRINVDDRINSTVCIVSSTAPSAGSFRIPIHVDLVTDALDSGQHTVNVQFLRESGLPSIQDRALTVMEIAA